MLETEAGRWYSMISGMEAVVMGARMTLVVAANCGVEAVRLRPNEYAARCGYFHEKVVVNSRLD
jgi:hypothetical protein